MPKYSLFQTKIRITEHSTVSKERTLAHIKYFIH